MCAPVVVCKTPIYHPNVDEQVCTSLVLSAVCVVTGAPIAGSRLFEHFAGGLETGGHSVICEARYVIMCDAQVLDIAACVHGLLFLFLVSGVWFISRPYFTGGAGAKPGGPPEQGGGRPIRPQ